MVEKEKEETGEILGEGIRDSAREAVVSQICIEEVGEKAKGGRNRTVDKIVVDSDVLQARHSSDRLGKRPRQFVVANV